MDTRRITELEEEINKLKVEQNRIVSLIHRKKKEIKKIKRQLRKVGSK